MPLIEQQAIVVASGQGLDEVKAKLEAQLEAYPPVRIVSISLSLVGVGHKLVAVVETI